VPPPSLHAECHLALMSNTTNRVLQELPEDVSTATWEAAKACGMMLQPAELDSILSSCLSSQKSATGLTVVKKRPGFWRWHPHMRPLYIDAGLADKAPAWCPSMYTYIQNPIYLSACDLPTVRSVGHDFKYFENAGSMMCTFSRTASLSLYQLQWPCTPPVL
jgi:hypothetical protein